jgi:hypothetical protein
LLVRFNELAQAALEPNELMSPSSQPCNQHRPPSVDKAMSPSIPGKQPSSFNSTPSQRNVQAHLPLKRLKKKLVLSNRNTMSTSAASYCRLPLPTGATSASRRWSPSHLAPPRDHWEPRIKSRFCFAGVTALRSPSTPSFRLRGTGVGVCAMPITDSPSSGLAYSSDACPPFVASPMCPQ